MRSSCALFTAVLLRQNRGGKSSKDEKGGKDVVKGYDEGAGVRAGLRKGGSSPIAVTKPWIPRPVVFLRALPSGGPVKMCLGTTAAMPGG